MGRRLRWDVEGGWHHVMNRGAARQRTFHTVADGDEFLRLVGVGHARFGVEVHAFCLMPNHFHLLLHCPSGGLGEFVQHVTGNYTRTFNERTGRDGALFRGRFHSVPVRDDRYVLAATRYIHRNPIGLPNVPDPARYRWSSHAEYVGDRPTPEWLRTDHVLDMFAGGRRAFHDAVFDATAAAVPRCQLLDLIALVIDEAAAFDRGRPPRLDRTVALAALGRVPPPVADALVGELGLDRSGLRRATRRASERVAACPTLTRLADAVAHRLT